MPLGDRRRSTYVTASLAACAAAGLMFASCERDVPDHRAVCVEDSTGRRVDDTHCEDSTGSTGGGFHWSYYGGGSRVPAVGAPAVGGTSVRPASGSVAHGAPAEGGVVARGGFGGHGTSHGSVGG